MIKKALIVVFLFFGTISGSALVRADVINENRLFFVDTDFDANGRIQDQATLRKISDNAYWYAENSVWNDSTDSTALAAMSNTLNNLASEFDYNIYPKLRALFGTEWNPGIDNDPKITIFLENMRSDAGGYFSPNDEYPKDQITGGRSNEREMLYLNIARLLDPRIKGFLAHEFQHLITFYQKPKLHGDIDDDVWLNELRSEYSETYLGYDNILYGSNLEQRKNDFLQEPSHSLTEWSNQKADYGSANMFDQYLADRFGSAIFTKMMQSPKTGIASVNDALAGLGQTVDFSQVFSDWLVTVFLNDCSAGAGQYCYKNPNLKNVKVMPTRIFPMSATSTAVVSQATEDWAGYWYEFDQWPGILKVAASSQDRTSKLKIPYFIVNGANKAEISEMAMSTNASGGEQGTAIATSSPAAAASGIFIPSNQFQTANFTESNATTTFSIAAEIISAAPEPTPSPSLAPTASLAPPYTPTPAITPTPAPSPPIAEKHPQFTRNLFQGSLNPEVSNLQNLLKSLPGIYPEGRVTGYFGPATQKAVQRFQCKYQIICSGTPKTTGYGKVGPKTREKLNSVSSATK